MQPDLRTLIAGDGPLRSRLEETARLYDLEGKVRFLGHREDVPRLMAAADLVVLPSAYEGLPNLVLEAMRFRKPVVATAAPGTTEVVVDGQTGVLVPVANPQLLARAIRDLVRDPALARRLGQAGGTAWTPSSEPRRWSTVRRPLRRAGPSQEPQRLEGIAMASNDTARRCILRLRERYYARLISNHSPGWRTTGVALVSLLTLAAHAAASCVMGGKVL